MDNEQWMAKQIQLREAMQSKRQTTGAPNSEPKVSVIVVCWNSERVLSRCIEQLLQQDYGNYEVVVVDDGSDDATLKVAESMLTCKEGKIVRGLVNRGCAHARNLGMRHATGEIIAFVDADGYADARWLSRIVAAFDSDETLGAVASTVFYALNPLVVNGAGGTVNRQGWAADLSMNESFESAQIATEALYPMGCGMAIRRSAVDRVGDFDAHIINYYDDVDYGIRLWRAGYRVIVASDAWIDHDLGRPGGDSPRKRLLCERHRMRVMLKHASARTLPRWAVHEALAIRRAGAARRARKPIALAWNVRHAASVLSSRWRLRRAPRVPDRLIHPSWGDAFPAGVPSRLNPRPETAGKSVDMADPGVEGQLVYGWFPPEHQDGRSYRWSGIQAAALIGLQAPARRLRLDYTQVPADTGGVDLSIRCYGSPDPLTPIWVTHLSWQYMERCVENHPIALPAGDYEVVFSARQAWSDPPHETRQLGVALARMSFDESYEIADGGLDMGSPAVEEQLVSGWFEAEQSGDRGYRWGCGHAAAVVRSPKSASRAHLSYCLPPGSIGGLKVTVCPLEQQRPVWSTRIAWLDGAWHDDSFPLRLAGGDYIVSFDAEATWSNPGQRDPAFWAENRSLGFALSSLSFGK
jgi:GT2 family glycosyltransferase